MQAFIKIIKPQNTNNFKKALIELGIFNRTKILKSGQGLSVMFKIENTTEEQIQELSIISDILNK